MGVEFVYAIKDWDRHYENNRTREMRVMAWVPIHIKFDGDGYTELVTGPDGPALYGAWVAIVGVAGRCDPRGVLVRDSGRPHDAATLSRITRIPEALIERALERLVSIGWIVHKRSIRQAFTSTDGTCPQEGAVDPAGIPHPPAEGYPPLSAPSCGDTLFLNGTPDALKIREDKKEEEEKTKKEGRHGGEKGVASKAKYISPQDLAARDLSKRLGSSLTTARQQVLALKTSGWDLGRIVVAIETHASAGLSPWDWTKRAKGGVAPVAGKWTLPPAPVIAGSLLCGEPGCDKDRAEDSHMCESHTLAAFERSRVSKSKVTPEH